jgi:glyoxylase-like metal-dependent hydrolase (beta-lactamase superfamily II)
MAKTGDVIMAMNRPISSPIKSKRFDMDELIYSSCWAFMRELRTHNSTKKIYDVDPYAEVYTFRDNLYAIFTDNIDGMGDAWSFLIEGPKKALLIDTSFGLGDLKGLVTELIGDKELIVANTHFHADHAGGNSQFGKVYALKEDAEMLRKNMNVPLLNEKMINPDGSCRCVEFDVNDMIELRPYEVVDIPDGYIFDLGDGYEVETIKLAGHTKGQAAFLDKRNRTLFPGDDIIAMRVGIGGKEPGTVREYRDNMVKLASRIDEFDGIFPGHFTIDIDSRAVLDMVDTLNAIIENPENYDYTETGKRGVSYCKTVKGMGCIAYQMEGI